MAEEKKAEKVDADRLCNAIRTMRDWIMQNAADIPMSVYLTYMLFMLTLYKHCDKMEKKEARRNG